MPLDQGGSHALAIEGFAFFVNLDHLSVERDAREVVSEAFRAEAEYHGLADDNTVEGNLERRACIGKSCAVMGCTTNVDIL